MSVKFKKVRKYVVSGALAAGIIIAGAAGYARNRAYAGENQQDRILDNIFIGDAAVGGMSEEEAVQAVQAYVDEVEDTPVTLTVNDKSVKAAARDLGVEWDNPQVVAEAMEIGKTGSLISRYKDKKDLEHEPKKLALSFHADEEQVEKYLKENADKMDQEAQDGGLERRDGAFVVTEGKEGIAVNVPESAKKVADYINSEWDAKEATIALTAEVVQPRGSAAELSKVKDVLGTFTTDFSSSNASRAQNVTTGCSKINGTLLYPGEEFSVYETVSPFDEENGYAKAGSYENGAVVETYGGGICQVSTTLYNAVIRAELEIKERYAHSMIVNYVQPSMDAAIAGTYKDLKFVNSTDAPVYIEGITGGGTITFTVYGQETRDADREVSFESEIVSETTPPTQIQASAAYDVGYVSVQQSSHAGKVARLWKVVTVGGKEISREIFNNSTYSASPRIMVVGTRTASAEARAIIQNAIATQNENTIYAAAANAAAVAAKPQDPEPEPEDPEGAEEGQEPEPDSGESQEKDDGKKASDKKASDKDSSDQKAADQKAADKKAADKKTQEKENSDKKAAEEQKTEKNKTAEKEAAVSE